MRAASRAKLFPLRCACAPSIDPRVPPVNERNAPTRRGSHICILLCIRIRDVPKKPYILPTILRPIWNWRFLGVKEQNADIYLILRVNGSDEPTHLHLICSECSCTLSNSIFRLIKEIFCYNTCHGLYFTKLQRLLKNFAVSLLQTLK